MEYHAHLKKMAAFSIEMGTPGENMQEIEHLFESMLSAAPNFLLNVLLAIVLLIIGYMIGALVGHIVRKLLEKFGVDKKMEKERISDTMGELTVSGIAGKIIKWYVFIIFVGESAEIISLKQFSGLVEKFVLWLPDLIFGIVILVAGLILAEYITIHLKRVRIPSVRIIASVVKVLIIFFVLVISLTQIGLNVGIVGNTFLIILASVCLALALALGIGFGLALKDEAKGMIRSLKKHHK